MAHPSDHELLEVAVEAADAAATELLERFGGRASGVRAKSTPTDLVSEADLAAERAIRAVLARRRPGDSILGEEGGATGSGELRWVVDPLDGTINFLYGFPVFAVSVACEDADGALAGVVLDPVREERFSATRSAPALLERHGDHRLGLQVARPGARGHRLRLRRRDPGSSGGGGRPAPAPGTGHPPRRAPRRSTSAGVPVGASMPTTSGGCSRGIVPPGR